MTNYRSLNHTKWACQYHVVFIPKYRKKVIYGGLRRYLGSVFRRLAQQRESEVEEGHLLADHVHMMFWARGYFVSTVGRDEAAIREYIRTQEQEDRRYDQLRLDEGNHL